MKDELGKLTKIKTNKKCLSDMMEALIGATFIKDFTLSNPFNLLYTFGF